MKGHPTETYHFNDHGFQRYHFLMDGGLVISTHLPCKGLVHHSIVTLPLKIGCLEFQLDDHSHPKTKVDNLKMMVSKKKESPLPGFHFQLNHVKLSWNLIANHLKIVGKNG